MTRSYHVVLEWDPDDRVWVTYVPALNFLSTFGENRDEALDRTREAILGYIEAAAEEGVDIGGDGPPAELVEIEVQAS